MRLLTILLAALLWAAWAAGPVWAGLLPDLSAGEHRTTFLYGGSAGQEAWYEFVLDGADAGDLIALGGLVPGLEVQRVEAWYRIRGDVAGDAPEEAQDFTIRTLYAIDTTPGPWVPYFGAEQVRWTSGPEIDGGYYGIGTEWHPSGRLTLDGSAWHDGGQGYRLCGSVEAVVRATSTVSAAAWVMIDRGDEWGVWRVVARHPAGEGLEVALVYEDSTRTDPVIMAGVSATF